MKAGTGPAIHAGFDALELRAGAAALAHLRERGLAPEHVGCIPAAAGGPKGLALIPLDTWLFGSWLARRPAGAEPLQLIGASIGAWRMAAAALPDPAPALHALAEAYLAQRYPRRPPPALVSGEIRKLARAVLAAGDVTRPAPGRALRVLAARARGALHAGTNRRAPFARAALANVLGRPLLARHLERVVFEAGPAGFPAAPWDRFGLQRVALGAHNAEDALTASGSIPLVCEPVADPAGAPAGAYWDGGLIDYHLALPYSRAAGLVLYPHFVPYLTPGWLDKFLPWRRRAGGGGEFARVLLIAPSRALLDRLPRRKLPDRGDFLHWGLDHDGRERAWRRALAECGRFAEQAARFIESPDPARVRPLGDRPGR